MMVAIKVVIIITLLLIMLMSVKSSHLIEEMYFKIML